MLNFYLEHQLNLMMILAGISGFVFLFLLCMKIDKKAKKHSFLQISLFAMLLLMADRLAYIYRGDISTVGYWMVRISNFCVYAMILLVENGFTHYLLSFVKSEKTGDKKLMPLMMARGLTGLGLVLLAISQFTGLYYTFDETNHYVRSKGFVICYIIPLIISVLQCLFIWKNRKIFRKRILVSLFAFLGLPILAGILQIPLYGASFTSVSIAISAIIIYFFALFDQNNVLVVAANSKMAVAMEMQEKSNELLQQTVEALASAVDAKDAYTHGHSNRVAKYAEKIARMAGMSDMECDEVYLAGLLHDVGKIGISDSIINKKGKLTDEEFAVIKQHPVLGGEILSKISMSPSLSVGARYHHERYDGKGYPENLKGEDIPNIARIIAVADAYDAMTSKRSYRDMIPRMYVREELVKGIGTQFDPDYAKLMIHLIDQDDEYKMKENQSEEVFDANLSFEFGEYKTAVTAGLRITDCPVRVKFQYKATKKFGMPTILFYDSADARYYLEDNSLSEEMDFIEYATIGMDGDVITDFVRKMKLDTTDLQGDLENSEGTYFADIQMIKQDDHLWVEITTEDRKHEAIFALHDASRFLYFALTGEHCTLDILEMQVSQEPVKENYIPRIAEKISYITNKPEGDIPNIQVDAWQSCHSEIVKVANYSKIQFHTMSLPSSRRVWHCPIICLFTSDDGTIEGEHYKELVFVRLDGESWCENKEVKNVTTVSKGENFENWSIWKQRNKAGVDCVLSLKHKGNIVSLQVEDSGITTVNQTRIPENVENVYCYLTGDQCAITNIRISND